jgi:hypothetical protein
MGNTCRTHHSHAIPAGMHNPFWNALMVEVKDFFAEMEIFQQCRAPSALAQRVLIVRDWNALLRCKRCDFSARDLMQFAIV